MNITQYLNVLQLEKRTPSLEFLNELIAAHQRTISFNNLAVYFRPGQILDLELPALFEKVILNREGGYCFENNKVFFYLLKELGFEVRPLAARVLYGQSGDVPRTHRSTLITLDDKQFVADVGFGRHAPPIAVSLDSQNSDSYSILKNGDTYLLKLGKEGQKIDLYMFDEGHYQESDFAIANYYTNTHPNSKFVKGLILSRREGNVVELISDRVYSRITDEGRTDQEILSSDEFSAILEKFGIQKKYDFKKLP